MMNGSAGQVGRWIFHRKFLQYRQNLLNCLHALGLNIDGFHENSAGGGTCGLPIEEQIHNATIFVAELHNVPAIRGGWHYCRRTAVFAYPSERRKSMTRIKI